MLLSTIKSDFYSRLLSLYPRLEIDSIFDLSVASLLNYSKIQIHQNLSQDISEEKKKQLLNCLDRLSAGEPIQYILGSTEFFGLMLKIDNRALIPRPETELLVQMAVKALSSLKKKEILDIGTGSGCIAISLGKNLPAAKITAMDVSPEAIELAKTNSKKHYLPIRFIEDDILDPCEKYPKYDSIISNPPYVRFSEKINMHKNVAHYEPSIALFVSDENPLIFYNAIADFGRDHLYAGGKLFLEINEFFGKEIKELLNNKGYLQVKIHNDLNDKNRFITAIR